ncbi:EAL domain-containing protein (plasmid) [Deinococcus sp. D7000]|nr:EAL domain-containing protein [Deinococcus sp. D7000]
MGHPSASELGGHVLKIARSFVPPLSLTASASPVVKAIPMLAHSRELEIVAEGVETQEERDLVRELGCHLGQGSLCARPSPFLPA